MLASLLEWKEEKLNPKEPQNDVDGAAYDVSLIAPLKHTSFLSADVQYEPSRTAGT